MDIPSLSLLLLLFLSLSQPSNAVNNNSELLNSICEKTMNYTKCVEALSSNPRTESAKTLQDLAEISLHLAIANAKESLVFLKQTLSTEKSNDRDDAGALVGRNGRAVAASIRHCVELYKTVIMSLRSALIELSEDAMTANYDVKTASDGADGCESEMVSKRVRNLSVSDRNYQLKFYSNIGDVITSML